MRSPKRNQQKTTEDNDGAPSELAVSMTPSVTYKKSALARSDLDEGSDSGLKRKASDVEKEQDDDDDPRHRSLIVERKHRRISLVKPPDTSGNNHKRQGSDHFMMTQSLEDLAPKKVKKRKLRESSQPQYVIVDDPNQILPKTRRVKKIKSPTNAQLQKVFVTMQ